jgi:hypothetical protein
MDAEPISKEIYEKAKAIGIEIISLKFSGGDDDGYLDVEVEPQPREKLDEMLSEIRDWAWSVYSYSGAGDGSRYGDNVIYNLKEGKVVTEEWYTHPVLSQNDPEDIKISKD